MNRNAGHFAGVLIFSAAIGMATDARADLVIDGFFSPAGGQVASDDTIGGAPVVNSLGSQPVLGTSREIFVNKTSEIGGGTQPVEASSNEVNTSIFNFDQFSSTARGTATLVYDGSADGMLNAKGLGGVDLTDGGLNAGFMFQNLNVTGSGLLLTVNLYNALTGAVVSSGPVSLLNGFDGNLLLLYSSFTGPGGLLTPTNVGAIEILVDGSNTGLIPGTIDAAGSDLTFSQVQSAAVPEPSSVLLCGLLSIAGAGYQWRRRRSATAA